MEATWHSADVGRDVAVDVALVLTWKGRCGGWHVRWRGPNVGMSLTRLWGPLMCQLTRSSLTSSKHLQRMDFCADLQTAHGGLCGDTFISGWSFQLPLDKILHPISPEINFEQVWKIKLERQRLCFFKIDILNSLSSSETICYALISFVMVHWPPMRKN